MNNLSNKSVRGAWRGRYLFGIRIGAILLVPLMVINFHIHTALASPNMGVLVQQRGDNNVSSIIGCIGLLIILVGLIVRFTYGSFAPTYNQAVTSNLPVSQVSAVIETVFPTSAPVGRPWTRKRSKEDPLSLKLSAYPLPYWGGCLIMLITGIILGFIAWILMGRVDKVTIRPVEEGEGSRVQIDALGYAAVSKAKELEAMLLSGIK